MQSRVVGFVGLGILLCTSVALAQQDAAEEDRQALIELVEQLKQQVAELKETTSSAQSKEQSLMAEVEAATAKAKESADELAAAGEQSAMLQTKLDEMQAAGQECQTKVAELEGFVERRDTAISQLENEKADLQQSLQQQEKQAMTAAGEQEEALTAKDGEIATLMQSSQKSESEVTKLRSMLQSARTNSSAIGAELGQVEAALTEANASHAAAVKEIQGNVSTLGVKLREARLERDSLAATIEEMKTKTHVVQAGDSLSKIARTYYGDAEAWPKIYQANRDQLSNPSGLEKGMTLVIPTE